MFYGIYGDSDGDSPQVIGEASWLMARTCFPNDNLNGGVGHDAADVTCKSGTYMSLFRHLLIQKDILFTGDDAVLPSSALNKNYVTNFTTLRSMGDKLMTALAKNLKLSGGGDGGSSPSATTTATGSDPTGGSCEWEGHCAGKNPSAHIFLRGY